jgi:hypothetical protein
MVDALELVEVGDRDEIIRHVMWSTGRAAKIAAAGVLLPFPASGRTEPRATPDFPIDPAAFNANGDADYPLELHGWQMDDLYAAAGDVGIQNSETSMGTILNATEVREGRVRVVRVQGNSMSPTFEHGWLIAVDLTKREPRNEDPVLIYRHETDGMILGRWEKRGRKVRLLKDNDAFDPIEMREGDRLVGVVDDIIKKPVPPPPARRRR